MRLTPILLILSLSGLAFAQDFAGSRQPTITYHAPAVTTIVRGHPSTVQLNFRIPGGFHINSNQPRQEYLKKTELKMDPPTDIAIEKVTYPQGEDRSFPFAPDEKLNVYTGDIAIGVVVRPLKTVMAARYASTDLATPRGRGAPPVDRARRNARAATATATRASGMTSGRCPAKTSPATTMTTPVIASAPQT